MTTVIMNTYNENPIYLKQAIESYKTQKDVQIIISTLEDDSNLKIYDNGYVDVVVFSSKKNHPGKCPKGSFYQLNRALEFIKGDYVCFASSNDVSLPKKLSMEQEMCINGKKVCYSSYIKTNANLKNRKLITFHDYDYKRHLQTNFVSDCTLIETELFLKYTPFDLELNNYAYWNLWLKIYQGEGNVFVYNPKPTWLYRQDEDSMHIKRRKDPTLVRKHKLDKAKMLSQYI